jgi:hypothetical protein
LKYRRLVTRFEKDDANSTGAAEPATPPATPVAKRGKRAPAKKGRGNGKRAVCTRDRAKKRKLEDEDAEKKHEANNADDGVAADDGMTVDDSVTADDGVTADDSVTADTEMEQEPGETEEIEGDSNKENEAEC